MATASYLDAVAGGMVTAAAFDDDETAVHAVTLLRESGVREQDLCVLASDRQRAALIAGDHAWLPFKQWRGLRALLARLAGRGVPGQVRKRYGRALRSGKIVLVAAAGGQPADTIAALLEQSRGASVDSWWQTPTYLFAPPELAGPF